MKFIDSVKGLVTARQVFERLANLQPNKNTCLCPFHTEKTPSFHIKDDGVFKCFGCGEGGNGAIDAIISLGKASTPFEAARFLNAEFNLGIKEPEMYFDKEQEGLYAIMAKVALFFSTNIPSDNKSLCNAFKDKQAELEQLGLATKNNGVYYDAFTNSKELPIYDINGNVCTFAFIAKTKLGEKITIPSNPLFSGGHVLYGFNKAKITQKQPIIWCLSWRECEAHNKVGKTSICLLINCQSKGSIYLLDRLCNSATEITIIYKKDKTELLTILSIAKNCFSVGFYDLYVEDGEKKPFFAFLKNNKQDIQKGTIFAVIGSIKDPIIQETAKQEVLSWYNENTSELIKDLDNRLYQLCCNDMLSWLFVGLDDKVKGRYAFELIYEFLLKDGRYSSYLGEVSTIYEFCKSGKIAQNLNSAKTLLLEVAKKLGIKIMPLNQDSIKNICNKITKP